MIRGFKMKYKSFYIIFKRLLLKEIKQILSEGESPISNSLKKIIENSV